MRAAEALNYDVHVLAQRFNAGFEQVCHRLTTLQRPNARGVPFFLLRVDNAGNVSKRFSSGTFPFSKFGGTCPLWNVHSTFDTPDRLLKQVIELPDGTRYFSIAQMVRRPVAPHPQPQPRFAIGLGCEIRHAAKLVYAAGHGPGESRGHADRRQLPALRARKLQPARRAADHAHADPGREHAACEARLAFSSSLNPQPWNSGNRRFLRRLVDASRSSHRLNCVPPDAANRMPVPMIDIPAAVDDPQRLQILKDYDILDTPPEPGLDDVVTLASDICKTPITLVSLMIQTDPWFKAVSGLDVCDAHQPVGLRARAGAARNAQRR